VLRRSTLEIDLSLVSDFVYFWFLTFVGVLE
jgi:hypothetical protein